MWNPARRHDARKCKSHATLVVILVAIGVVPAARAQEKAELVQHLNNPFANLVSLSFFNDWERSSGRDVRYTMYFIPVVPLAVRDRRILVSRVLMPVVANGAFPGEGQNGLGDTEISFFLSPARAREGFVWGLGPHFLLPTATNSDLGDQKWGAGLAGAALFEKGSWSAGLLANHAWSFAGSGPSRVSATFLDPWISRSWTSGFACTLETESTYDWESLQWTVPIEAGISQLVTIGRAPIELGLTGLYYTAHEEGDARWGVRVSLSFVFERK